MEAITKTQRRRSHRKRIGSSLIRIEVTDRINSSNWVTADVVDIIDGGFGARLRNEPQTGTTTWLNYPMEVTNLVAGQATVRPFEIRVPGDAGPGEYITSIVLENDQPIADSGTVGTNQIIRQAVGVVVTVPGTRSPGLAIGAASARTFAGTSVVSVGVANTGNVRLKPVALLTITDAGGGQVGQSRIQMDSFYALTRTLIEVPLPAVLAPGTYIVRVALADSSQNVGVERAAIALVVEGAPATDSSSGGSGDLPSITQVTDEHALPVVAIALIAALMLGSGVLAGVVSFALLRRRGAAG